MMNDIDDKIRHALNAEDQKILDQFGDDPGVFGMVIDSFKGSQWWFTTGPVDLWLSCLRSHGVLYTQLLLCRRPADEPVLGYRNPH